MYVIHNNEKTNQPEANQPLAEKLTNISSHSYSVVIPKEYIDMYNWKLKMEIDITNK
jgi:hypothetical protein